MYQLKCITPWKRYGWKKLAVKNAAFVRHRLLADYRARVELTPE